MRACAQQPQRRSTAGQGGGEEPPSNAVRSVGVRSGGVRSGGALRRNSEDSDSDGEGGSRAGQFRVRVHPLGQEDSLPSASGRPEPARPSTAQMEINGVFDAARPGLMTPLDVPRRVFDPRADVDWAYPSDDSPPTGTAPSRQHPSPRPHVQLPPQPPPTSGFRREGVGSFAVPKRDFESERRSAAAEARLHPRPPMQATSGGLRQGGRVSTLATLGSNGLAFFTSLAARVPGAGDVAAAEEKPASVKSAKKATWGENSERVFKPSAKHEVRTVIPERSTQRAPPLSLLGQLLQALGMGAKRRPTEGNDDNEDEDEEDDDDEPRLSFHGSARAAAPLVPGPKHSSRGVAGALSLMSLSSAASAASDVPRSADTIAAALAARDLALREEREKALRGKKSGVHALPPRARSMAQGMVEPPSVRPSDGAGEAADTSRETPCSQPSGADGRQRSVGPSGDGARPALASSLSSRMLRGISFRRSSHVEEAPPEETVGHRLWGIVREVVMKSADMDLTNTLKSADQQGDAAMRALITGMFKTARLNYIRKRLNGEWFPDELVVKPPPPWHLHPTGRFRSFWDAFLLVFVLFNAWEVPFVVGINPPRSDVLDVIDYIINVFFAFDIMFAFFTAVQETGRSGELITNRREIMRIYLRSWCATPVPPLTSPPRQLR